MSDDLVREKVRLYATEVTPAQLPSFGGVAVRRRRRRVRQALGATSSVVVVALVVVFAALASQSSATRTIAPSGSLEGQLVGPTWTLVSVTDSGVVWPVPASKRWTLALTRTTFSGFDSCNSITGSVSFTGTTLTMGAGSTTTAACRAADWQRLAETFQALESGPAEASVSGGTLTLTVGSKVLTLRPAPVTLPGALVGPRWLLESWSGSPGSGRAVGSAWVQFTADGLLAEDGCNSHSGPVTYDGSTLRTTGLGSSYAYCSGDSSRVGHAYDALFAGAVRASLSGATLRLTGSGVVMTFTQGPAPATTTATTAPVATIDPGALQANLEGVSWVLRSVSDNGKVTHVPASQHARLYLSAGNYYFDNGCSIDYGRMEYDNTQVTMTGQGGVGSLCPYSLPEFSTPSTAFTAVAEGKPVFRFTSSGITLGAGKIVLTFDRTTPVDVHTALHQAVVGHVWRLTGYSFKGKAYSVPAGATPTLELADAQYEAFDGCNSSAGYLSYVTGTLWVRPVAGNVVRCGQEWYSATEAFAGVLLGDTHAAVTGTTLTMTGNGATLVFSRGPASARTVFDNLPPLPPF